MKGLVHMSYRYSDTDMPEQMSICQVGLVFYQNGCHIKGSTTKHRSVPSL